MKESNIYHDDYLRRLIIESPYIRAKLTNPGGSIILFGAAASTEQPQEYSTQIGSGFHLDLVETELHLKELPLEEQQVLLTWAQGLSAKQAAMYFSATGTVFRKRRERTVEKLTDRMNEDERGPRSNRGSRELSFEERSRPTRRFT